MELRISFLAQDRKFSKAMRRVRPRLQRLLDEFAEVEMTDPIHQAILVGITDNESPNFFEEIENNDGFFQVLAGTEFTGSDDELAESIYAILEKAVSACPFSRPDQEKFMSLLDRMRPEVLN